MTGGMQNIYARHAAIRANVKLKVTVTTEASSAGNLGDLRSWSIERPSFRVWRRRSVNGLRDRDEHRDGDAAPAQQS